MGSTREASHAGSWYTSNPSKLSSELDNWLSQVPSTISDTKLPVPGARVIIAPHAGYSYSGPAAAWAYATLDLSAAKRIFLLGPSHAWYLTECALSKHSKYATPLGDLAIDTALVQELSATGEFKKMSTDQDETEHSLEMHLPYIYKLLSLNFSSPSSFPPLIPILVGNTNPTTERKFGSLLAPYLSDPSNIFIISSDFCHWGPRFQYTYYLPASPSSEARDKSGGYSLSRRDKAPTQPPIHESIGRLDQLSMDAISGGVHQEFLDNLEETGNTVCGRHPIGVIMAAIEKVKGVKNLDEEKGKGKFKFVRYERSNEVTRVDDGSVSYASAYAVL